MSLVSIPLWQSLLMWSLAASMAIATSVLLKWTVRAKENKAPLDVPFILFILITMLAMIVSAVAYLLSPSTGLLLDLIVINMFVMTGGILPIFLFISLRVPQDQLAVDETDQISILARQNPTKPLESHRGMIVPLVATLVILNEFFMGWALVIASGAGVNPSNLLALFSSVVNSYWFVFTMSGEMLLTTYLLRNEIGKSFVYIVAFQSLIMLFSPPVAARYRV